MVEKRVAIPLTFWWYICNKSELFFYHLELGFTYCDLNKKSVSLIVKQRKYISIHGKRCSLSVTFLLFPSRDLRLLFESSVFQFYVWSHWWWAKNDLMKPYPLIRKKFSTLCEYLWLMGLNIEHTSMRENILEFWPKISITLDTMTK